MVFLLFAIGDGRMDIRAVGEHELWVVEKSTEGLNVPVEKVLGMFSPDEMVVKWCGGLKYNDGVAVGWESSGLADSESDVAKYRGVDDEDDYLLVRAAMGDEDRKGDVIVPSGWVLDGYRQNPVILWAHDRTLPPIGRSHRVWTDEKGLIAEVEFAQTKLAQDVAGLYRTGFMRGVSVGFLPLEVETRQASHGRRAYKYVRQELLEISAVPVPMHSGALSKKELNGVLRLDDADVAVLSGVVRELKGGMEWLLD